MNVRSAVSTRQAEPEFDPDQQEPDRHRDAQDQHRDDLPQEPPAQAMRHRPERLVDALAPRGREQGQKTAPIKTRVGGREKGDRQEHDEAGDGTQRPGRRGGEVAGDRPGRVGDLALPFLVVEHLERLHPAGCLQPFLQPRESGHHGLP
jgi:hypothetical protein